MKSDLWSYSGKPEYVSLQVRPLTPLAGGYIIFIFLVDGTTWIFSSSNPGGCISSWKNKTKKYDLPATKSVMVSQPYYKYTEVKNKIIEKLTSYKQEKKGGFLVDLNTVIQESEIVMEMARPALNIKGVTL